MKKYTSQLLIGTLITLALGFTGLEFPGETLVRILFLIFSIGLLLSCLDEVLISQRMKKIRLKKRQKNVRKDFKE